MRTVSVAFLRIRVSFIEFVRDALSLSSLALALCVCERERTFLEQKNVTSAKVKRCVHACLVRLINRNCKISLTLFVLLVFELLSSALLRLGERMYRNHNNNNNNNNQSVCTCHHH